VDVNGDGKLDLIVASGCDDVGIYGCSSSAIVSVLLGNGDGTFQAAVNYDSGSIGETGSNLAVADVNGDGKPDVIVVNGCDYQEGCANGSVSVLLGNGDGTLQPAVSYSPGGYSVAVADVNGDGKPDLVLANGEVAVMLGNGDGTFQPAVSYSSGGENAFSVAVADVNGDGIPDLVVANGCADSSCANGSASVLLGNGDGTFQAAVSYGSGGLDANGVAVTDVNGDGKPDVIVLNECAFNQEQCANGSAGVLLGNGDGTFQAAVTYLSGGQSAVSIVVGDVNQDGKPDILLYNSSLYTFGSYDGVVDVLLGNGDGTFQAATDYISGANYNNARIAIQALALGDVNGDGKRDLVVTAEGDSCCLTGDVSVFLNVYQAPASNALSSSVNPSAFGQSVIFTATVTSSSPGTPTGTVTFTYGSTTLCTAVTLSNGTASCAYSALPVGTDSVTAAYSGDVNFSGSSASLNQVVNLPSTGITLTSSLNPSVQGKLVTLTATVSSQSGAATPTGTVTFQNGSTVLATKTLSRGTAKYTTSALPAGSNTITAVYGGSTTYSGGTSAPLIQAVTATTITVVTSSPNPSAYGQTVLFVAAVASSIGAPPDGETITFEQGTTVLGTGTLSGGIATFLDSKLGVGTDSVKAVYAGDANFEGSTSTVSHVIDQAATTTTLVSSLNPSNSGQRVTFTAKVSGQFGGTVSGAVTFTDGNTTLQRVTLSGGIAEYTTSALASGNHNITATYDGSREFTVSSASLTQTIN
jgi:hypothetical protein